MAVTPNPDTLKTTVVQVAQVVGANASAISIAFSHINEMLTTLSLVLASTFTVYKFIRDWKKKAKE